VSNDQVTYWARLLGRTTPERIAVIHELLAHANEDRMSIADRHVCRRALTLLGA
jgi:hypothetical protein